MYKVWGKDRLRKEDKKTKTPVSPSDTRLSHRCVCRSKKKIKTRQVCPILHRQVRISYFRDKCVISARNCKIADLIQLVRAAFAILAMYLECLPINVICMQSWLQNQTKVSVENNKGISGLMYWQQRTACQSIYIWKKITSNTCNRDNTNLYSPSWTWKDHIISNFLAMLSY